VTLRELRRECRREFAAIAGGQPALAVTQATKSLNFSRGPAHGLVARRERPGPRPGAKTRVKTGCE